MEARRTLQGGVSSSKSMWIVVAALAVVLALAIASLYLAKAAGPVSAPASSHVVRSFQAPDAQDRNAAIRDARGTSLTEQQIMDNAVAGIKPFRESHGH